MNEAEFDVACDAFEKMVEGLPADTNAAISIGGFGYMFSFYIANYLAIGKLNGVFSAEDIDTFITSIMGNIKDTIIDVYEKQVHQSTN